MKFLVDNALSPQVAEGLRQAGHFNAENEVVAIEVLDLKRRVPKADLEQLKVEVA